MKIAIINPWAVSGKAIGGTERFVMDLAGALQKLGNEVDVYMFSGETHIENNIKYININLFNTNGDIDEYVLQETFGDFETRQAYERLADKLENLIDVSKYDFIHLNSQLFLETWKNKKRIFTIHTNPFEYEFAWGKKSYEKMLELMKEARGNGQTVFVAPSKYYAHEYKELTTCNVKYIPHAIDIARLDTDKRKKDIIQQYYLEENKIRIILPSRLEPVQKQPMKVLEACSLFENSMKKKIQIIFTGLDNQYNQYINNLNELAEINKIDIKIIRFDSMSEAYEIADIIALPSKSESFGYSALESLSLGISTILNDIPTFREIAYGNTNNVIFDNSIGDLKEKLLKIIEDETYKKRIYPTKEWKSKYNLLEFGKAYLSLE